MRNYHVRITGTMPIIFHWDDIVGNEKIAAWRQNPEHKKHCVRGDDRSPPWTWIVYCYHAGDIVGVPSDNLMTMLREGASKVPLPGGRATETYKKISQTGLLITDQIWEIKNKAGDVQSWNEIKNTLWGEMDFEKHLDYVESHGFTLNVKRAKVGQAKHIRVRPMWNSGWSVEGGVTILDDKITKKTLLSIFEQAGRYCGLGDWRPSSPKSPGPYGAFEVKID